MFWLGFLEMPYVSEAPNVNPSHMFFLLCYVSFLLARLVSAWHSGIEGDRRSLGQKLDGLWNHTFLRVQTLCRVGLAEGQRFFKG